jgi:hypothetical protein
MLMPVRQWHLRMCVQLTNSHLTSGTFKAPASWVTKRELGLQLLVMVLQVLLLSLLLPAAQHLLLLLPVTA